MHFAFGVFANAKIQCEESVSSGTPQNRPTTNGSACSRAVGYGTRSVLTTLGYGTRSVPTTFNEFGWIPMLASLHTLSASLRVVLTRILHATVTTGVADRVAEVRRVFRTPPTQRFPSSSQ